MAELDTLVEIHDERVRAILARVPAVLGRHMGRAFQLHGQEFDREMQLRMRKGGGGPQRRTGRLARSIGFRVTGESLGELQIQAYSSGVPYAGIQERGGTVRPKPPRKFLTIPVLDNLTAAGVPRFPSAADLRATQPGKTFVFATKDGRLFIGYRPSAKAKMRVLFRLKESVEIPPRLGFYETWERLAPSRERRHVAAVKAAVKEAIGP